jgi:hypothetical protein
MKQIIFFRYGEQVEVILHHGEGHQNRLVEVDILLGVLNL